MTQPHSYRSILLLSLAAFVATLTVYLLTMPQTITLEDAGLFQMVCHEGGIGHPPGYPLFILSCQAFVSLPIFDNSVFAANLLSALYAALACAVLVCVAYELTGNEYAALLAGGLYGFSETLWSQAIIVEVYSLAALLFAISLWLCLLYRRHGNDALLICLALVTGLGLANHWPLHLLAAPALVISLGPAWIQLVRKLSSPLLLFMLALAFSLGISPYLSLFQADPVMALYGSIDSVEEFIRYVRRDAYSDHSEIAGWADRAAYQLWVWRQTMIETSVLLVPFMLLGIVLSFRQLGLIMASSLLALYLGSTSLLILLLGFEYNDFRVAIFKPYPVIAYQGVVLWIAMGAALLFGEIEKRRPAAGIVLLAVMLAWVLGVNFESNDRRHNDFTERFAVELLNQLPTGAVMIAEGDNIVGPLGYLHHVRGLRPDIELRSWHNLLFANRLATPYAPDEQQRQQWTAFLAAESRPVYATSRQGFTARHQGLVFQIGPRDAAQPCDARLHAFVDYVLELRNQALLSDEHERALLSGILLELSRQHVGLVAELRSAQPQELDVLQALQQTFEGAVASIEYILAQQPGPEARPYLLQMIAVARQQLQPGMSAQTRSLMDYFDGRAALLEPEGLNRATMHFERSVDVFPSAANPAACSLVEMYGAAGEAQQQQATVTRLDLSCN